jgi:hypothetical protein
VTVAVKATVCPTAIDVEEAESAVADAAEPVIVVPYKLSKTVLPTRMSGAEPAVRFAATAGPDAERLIRSLGMRLGAVEVPVLTEVKVPSPLP